MNPVRNLSGDSQDSVTAKHSTKRNVSNGMKASGYKIQCPERVIYVASKKIRVRVPRKRTNQILIHGADQNLQGS